MKLYPDIVFAAKNNPETAGMIGGVKLFFIAKHFDRVAGSGIIHEKEFKKFFRRYVGLSRATYYRWRKQALELGLFVPGVTNRDYLILSWERAAVAIECRRIGHPVEVSLDRFAASQDLSEVWAGYMKRHEPRKATEKAPAEKQHVIAKATLRELTGVPESTQRRYEEKAGIEKNPNFAIICSDPVRKPELAQTEQAQGFYCKNGKHYKRLGNTYRAPSRIKACKPGRTSKVNRAISAKLSPRAGSSQEERSLRLYYTPRIKQVNNEKKPNSLMDIKVTPREQIEKKLKKLAGMDTEKRPVRLFSYDRTYQNMGLWTACDVALGVFG